MLNKAIATYLIDGDEYTTDLINKAEEKHGSEFKELLEQLNLSKSEKNKLDDIFVNVCVSVGDKLYKRGFYDCLNMLKEGLNSINEKDVEKSIKEQRQENWANLLDQARKLDNTTAI